MSESRIEIGLSPGAGGSRFHAVSPHKLASAGRQVPPAFTLVELLVAIAVIGILAALLVPALAKARARGQCITCLNNMRQVGAAMHTYGLEFAGNLPNPNALAATNFNDASAPDNPLKLLRPYVGAKSPDAPTPVYVCPTAKPTTNAPYAPVGNNSTVLVFSQVVLNRGLERVRSPSGTVAIQEYLP